MKTLLREMYYVATKERAETLMRRFGERFGREYPRAVDCLLKDQKALLTFYAYPRQHWPSLKTTNPIFATVKLRTNAARRINAPNLVTKVLEGVKFEDGIEVTAKWNQTERDAA